MPERLSLWSASRSSDRSGVSQRSSIASSNLSQTNRASGTEELAQLHDGQIRKGTALRTIWNGSNGRIRADQAEKRFYGFAKKRIQETPVIEMILLLRLVDPLKSAVQIRSISFLKICSSARPSFRINAPSVLSSDL